MNTVGSSSGVDVGSSALDLYIAPFLHRHDKINVMVVDYSSGAGFCFWTEEEFWSNGPPCCKYYIYQYKLVIVVAIVGVTVVVVDVGVVVVVVESSSVVKLLFVVT
ncbi:hypothetical protein Tco_1516143 [Tanacetum coccineum]